MKTIKYFSAKWCGPCRTFKPVMEEISSEGYSVQFIDVDESYSLQEEYKVTSVPTIVIEENGVVVNRKKFTEYSVVADMIARRTDDESGDYIVKHFDIEARENLDDGTIKIDSLEMFLYLKKDTDSCP